MFIREDSMSKKTSITENTRLLRWTNIVSSFCDKLYPMERSLCETDETSYVSLSEHLMETNKQIQKTVTIDIER